MNLDSRHGELVTFFGSLSPHRVRLRSDFIIHFSFGEKKEKRKNKVRQVLIMKGCAGHPGVNDIRAKRYLQLTINNDLYHVYIYTVWFKFNINVNIHVEMGQPGKRSSLYPLLFKQLFGTVIHLTEKMKKCYDPIWKRL